MKDKGRRWNEGGNRGKKLDGEVEID